jgi:serine/threonine protein kinase
MSTLPPAQRKVAKELFGYRVRKVIGDGAWSRVYEVEDTKKHTAYALKHVIGETEKQERYLDQLRAEWRVGKGLNHPAIRKLISLEGEGLLNKLFRTKSSELGLVMELIDAPPLSEHVYRRTRPSMPECLRIFTEVSSGLLHMHAKGFVHADMKPLNILYEPERRITKLIDLGQSVDIGTQKPRLQGSPGYIAPEQATESKRSRKPDPKRPGAKSRLFEPVTEKTDVFNFGATMYVIASKGRFAPQSQHTNDPEVALEPALLGPRDLVMLGDTEIPRDLSELVSKCLVHDPAGRPTMDRVLRTLQSMQS